VAKDMDYSKFQRDYLTLLYVEEARSKSFKENQSMNTRLRTNNKNTEEIN
jgi:hypothetical protein